MPIANMPKNSAAHEKKVDAAVRLLQTTTGVRVPQVMILAGFSKKDVANKIVRQMVGRRYQQTLINARTRPQTLTDDVVIGDESSLSDLTFNDEDVQSPPTTTSSFQTPKRKQIMSMLNISNGPIKFIWV
jgi:hypothetical protein